MRKTYVIENKIIAWIITIKKNDKILLRLPVSVIILML